MYMSYRELRLSFIMTNYVDFHLWLAVLGVPYKRPCKVWILPRYVVDEGYHHVFSNNSAQDYHPFVIFPHYRKADLSGCPANPTQSMGSMS